MAVEYKDYYKILGVSRTAAKDDIAKSFKKLARKYHPDFNPGDKTAESKFKDISEAYEVLKDDEKRRLYDHLGPNWQEGQHFQHPPGFEGTQFSFTNTGGGFQGMGTSPFSEFFESLFGGGMRGSQSASFGGSPFEQFTQRPMKGQDVESRLQLTLEEAYHGGTKSISLRSPDGSVRTFEVKIPAGVKNGAKIRLAGRGEAGSGQPGDLYLQVQLLPHVHFVLDDSDVVYELPVAPWEAVLGAKLRVPTLDGTIELSIPAGTNSRKKFRLRGRGLGSGVHKGDQLVRVIVNVPEQLSAEERVLWEKLRDIAASAAK